MSCNSVRQEGLASYTMHKLYTTWRMMNYRCYSSVHGSYARYGGSGICVSERWRWDNPSGFVNFIADVGERHVNFTLDRIDPNGNYTASNCRWADKRTQQNNFRRNVDSETGYLGVTLDVKGRYVAKITLNSVSVTINNYETLEEAISAREMALHWKMQYGDDKAFEMVASNIKLLSNGKRPYGRKSSKYYGVSFDKLRDYWRAQVPVRDCDGKLKQKYLGSFDTEEEANKAVINFLEGKKDAGSI